MGVRENIVELRRRYGITQEEEWELSKESPITTDCSRAISSRRAG